MPTASNAFSSSITWSGEPRTTWRRVVASPVPKKILELDTVRALLDAGFVVVAAGGGGPGWGPPVFEGPRPDVGEDRGGQADVGQHRLAAEVAARHQQVARLLAEEGDSDIGPDRRPTGPAGGAVEARGHIDGDNGKARAVDGGGEIGREVAGKACPEKCIDEEFRLADVNSLLDGALPAPGHVGPIALESRGAPEQRRQCGLGLVRIDHRRVLETGFLEGGVDLSRRQVNLHHRLAELLADDGEPFGEFVVATVDALVRIYARTIEKRWRFPDQPLEKVRHFA